MATTSDEVALKHELTLACRILGREGRDDSVFGHLSARLPGADCCWMKGAEVGLGEVTEDDLVLIDLDGRVLAGQRPRHGEYPIHTEIYRARPDVGAIVHTHPPFGVAFGATAEPLRPVGHEGSLFAPPGVPRFTATSDLILTRQRGEMVADCLGDHRALFLQNHGVVVTGQTVREAAVAAILLEKACRLQLSLLGARWYSWSSPEDALAKRQYVYGPRSLAAVWEFYVRRHCEAGVLSPES